MAGTKNQVVIAGLGGAGNCRLVTATMPSKLQSQTVITYSTPGGCTAGIGGGGNIYAITGQATLSTEALLPDHVHQDNGPASWDNGTGTGNCVYHGGSSSSATSSTSSNSSFPSSSCTSNASPCTSNASPCTFKATMSRAENIKARLEARIAARNARTCLIEAWHRTLPTYPMEYDYRSSKMSSPSSLSSRAAILFSKLGDLKDRVLWRLDRILTFGLDDGLATKRPVYSKLKAGA